MSNLGFGSPRETAQLDLSRFPISGELREYAEIVYDEIERRREEDGGTRGGKPDTWLLGGLLGSGELTDGDFANTRRWYEYLTDFKLIERAGPRLNLTAEQFLTACIDRLNPPNWQTLFWMRAYLESSAGALNLAAQIARRELLAAKQARIETARKGAAAMLANDPRQDEKAFVLQCWLAWKGDPKRYTGKAAFARDMLSRCEELSSKAVIERWCREWERELLTKQAG